MNMLLLDLAPFPLQEPLADVAAGAIVVITQASLLDEVPRVDPPLRTDKRQHGLENRVDALVQDVEKAPLRHALVEVEGFRTFGGSYRSGLTDGGRAFFGAGQMGDERGIQEQNVAMLKLPLDSL